VKRQILVLIVLAFVVTATLPAGGCGNGGSGETDAADGDSSTTTVAGTVSGRNEAAAVLSPGDGLGEAKQRLALVLGLTTEEISVSSLPPESAGTDTVLVFETGRAEIDSATGRVHVVDTDQASPDPRSSPESEVHLAYTAGRIPGTLGWDEDMLTGMGFQQAGEGSISADSSLFSRTWEQYEADGAPTGGFIEVYLDAHTARLISFSVYLAGEVPDISGVIGATDAMAIAQTEIFLKTSSPRIPMTVDGSLILLGKTVSRELKVVEDTKITRGEQVLAWVIFVKGTVGDAMVGGTVYIDAMSGRILAYQPLPEE